MFEVIKYISKNNGPLILHADLISLGRELIKCRGKLIDKIIKESENSYFYIPTFTFYEDEVFTIDLRSNVSGVLSNELIDNLDKKQYSRTFNPIHSFGFTENDMNPSGSNINTKSFGKGSIFDYFYKENLMQIYLGINPNNSYTIFHHCEALVGVKYRRWITIKKKVKSTDNEDIETVSYQYFDKIKPIEINFVKVVNDLVSKDILKQNNINKTPILYGKTRTMVDFVCDMISNNENYLLV